MCVYDLCFRTPSVATAAWWEETVELSCGGEGGGGGGGVTEKIPSRESDSVRSKTDRCGVVAQSTDVAYVVVYTTPHTAHAPG